MSVLKSKVRKGTVLRTNGGFTCVKANQLVTIHECKNGLYFDCKDGKHFLDGQINGRSYVGLDKVRVNWRPMYESLVIDHDILKLEHYEQSKVLKVTAEALEASRKECEAASGTLARNILRAAEYDRTIRVHENVILGYHRTLSRITSAIGRHLRLPIINGQVYSAKSTEALVQDLIDEKTPL